MTMEETEYILKAIMKFKAKQHFSLDIYFNDIDNTFVAKIHNYGKNFNKTKHFRNQKLIDSLTEAYNFCNNEL